MLSLAVPLTSQVSLWETEKESAPGCRHSFIIHGRNWMRAVANSIVCIGSWMERLSGRHESYTFISFFFLLFSVLLLCCVFLQRIFLLLYFGVYCVWFVRCSLQQKNLQTKALLARHWIQNVFNCDKTIKCVLCALASRLGSRISARRQCIWI